MPIYGLQGELLMPGDCSTSLTTASGTVHWDLSAPVGDYHKGIVNDDGAYSVTASSGYTDSTYFFQLCENMRFTSTAQSLVCGSSVSPQSYCPPTCKQDDTCGTACSAIVSQKNSGSSYSSCWTLGMWDGGQSVNITLLNAADPAQGVSYKMTNGDTLGCPGGRTFSVNIQCPPTGRAGAAVPPTTVTSGQQNCDYSVVFVHPSGCPLSGAAGSGGGGLTWGGYFMVFSSVGLVLYGSVGAGLNHRSGKAGLDLVPNLGFWQTLPGLIRDGVFYFTALCKQGIARVRGGGGGDGSGSGFSTIS